MLALVDQYFHTFKDGKMDRQGQVIGTVGDRHVYVQYFSWFDGGETDGKIVPLDAMLDWTFYADGETFREAGGRNFACTLKEKTL